MKGWSAVFLAFAIGAAPAATHAQSPAADLTGAARELAHKTAILAGKGEAVAVTWRDLSSLGSGAVTQARNAFEAALREAGLRPGELAAAAEAQITLSQNESQYLLVEEIRKGDAREVWMAAWTRNPAAGPSSAAAVMLESRLVWEQPEQMLDVVWNGDGMLVLSGSGITRFTRSGAQWQARERVPLAPVRPWPRDLRGRLRWNAGGVQASLPGMTCSGTVQGALTAQCRPSDEPWTLESGRALLLASFAAGRNYFDGHVVAQTGARKTVPPFYSAAAVDESGRPLWLLATVDGGTQMFDASLEPAGVAGAWGSDLAGTDVQCGEHTLLLATRPGDGREPDAIRAFAVVNRAAVPMGAPAEFPGPVTALWPAAGGAMAIVRNGATGQSQAYAVTVACGQ